jgi:hypothetical protein
VFHPDNRLVDHRAPVSSYHEGGSLRLAARLLNHAGEVIAPTKVRLALLPPGATTPIDHPVTYEGESCVAVVALAESGLWRYAFQADDPSSVYESAFFVSPRRVPPPPE